MKIKAGQKLIDKIRGKKHQEKDYAYNPYYFLTKYNINPKDVKYIEKKKQIINKIRSLKDKIKYQDPKDKSLFKDYSTNYSALDPLGCILKKGNKIYRGVYVKSEKYFKELYETGILQTLAEYKLIPKFRITEYYTDDFPIIFEIEKLRIIPSQYWSFSMTKEEAKIKLFLIDILKEFGYGLIDGHCDNATFKDGIPIFFDFGSIIKDVHNHNAIKQIYKCNITSLMMHTLGDCYCTRNIHTIVNCTTLDAFDTYEYKQIYRRFLSNNMQYKLKKIIKHRQYIYPEMVDLLFPQKDEKEKSFWCNYSINDKNIEISERFSKIIDKIKKYSSDAKSFLDLAGNSGVFSDLILKNTQIKDVSCMDLDEGAIERGINAFNGINFILSNSVLPQNTEKNIFEELKADIVSALAVTHHILLTQHIDVDYMLNTIKKYMRKYLYIEFCPLGMYSASNPEYIPEVPYWYTQAWFEKHLEKFFNILDVETISFVKYKGKNIPHRVLFICQLKEVPNAF